MGVGDKRVWTKMKECGVGGTDGREFSGGVCGDVGEVRKGGKRRKEGKGVRDCQDNNTLLINNVV